MPKISVIVPVYNVEPYIHRCVDSILSQTFQDFELILVDDGSTDNSGRICDQYAEKDRRVQVIHQENGGLSAARNTGIDLTFKNSKSEWITFIDSDDFVHHQFLNALLNAAETYNADLSLCGFVRDLEDFPDKSHDILQHLQTETEAFYVKHFDIATIACGKLYKKYLFSNIRYPIGKIHEDTLTTYKILFQFPKLVVLTSNLYFYFYNPTSTINSPWSKKKLTVLEAYEEQILFFKKNKFNRALKFMLRIYIMQLYDWINMPLESLSQEEEKKYKKIWKKKLRKCFIKYNSICPFKKYEWIYEKAFPISTRIYYGVLRRLKHR